MPTQQWFAEPTAVSLVKSRIVSDYFWSWATIIISASQKYNRRRDIEKIAYVDLYSGPGCYGNGAKSTPLLVLEKAIADDKIRTMLVTIFSDASAKNVRLLNQRVANLPDIALLKNAPVISRQKVGDDIASSLKQVSLVPSLFFLDPWGYAGVSLDLINAGIKDWGCECIFFFNYNRVNMHVDNKDVEQQIDKLFGKARADNLRLKIRGLPPEEREQFIVAEFVQALKKEYGKYVLLFRFKNERGTRTSHYLIFVTKNILGHDIMKKIMARESSMFIDGVPSFEFNPAKIYQPSLLSHSLGLNDLQEMLLTTFAGQTLSMKEIYEKHNIGTPFIEKNYKEALKRLENSGQIEASPPAKQRPRGTFSGTVRVRFYGK